MKTTITITGNEIKIEYETGDHPNESKPVKIASQREPVDAVPSVTTTTKSESYEVIIPTENPEKSKKSKKSLVYSKKKCKHCDDYFNPTGPRDDVCKKCRQPNTIKESDGNQLFRNSNHPF